MTVAEVGMEMQHSHGITEIPSNYSVDETVERLKGTFEAKDVTIFTVVDHSGEAAKAGLTMPPAKLLLFGSPRAGTPIMLSEPDTAIDLPLKILVRQDRSGNVWIVYNSSIYFQQRHGFTPELVRNIAIVKVFAATAAQ